jgi:hypothetical protein
LSRTTAALLCNIHWHGFSVVDLEAGVDIVLFDQLPLPQTVNALALCRNSKRVTSDQNNLIDIRYLVSGGFVPLGSLMKEGKPHPYAGTGFGFNKVASVLTDHNRNPSARYQEEGKYNEIRQFSFDGCVFKTVRCDQVESILPFDGWHHISYALSMAIPDEQDLLFAMTATDDNGDSRCGVTRWCYCQQGWMPTTFIPVTSHGQSFSEPTLVRDVNGTLLLSARGKTVFNQHDIYLWHSNDNGYSWEQSIHVHDARAQAPITLNKTVDGQVYLAGNYYFPGNKELKPGRRVTENREILCIWPLNTERNGFEPTQIAVDCRSTFGPPPSGGTWRVDHANGANVRLKDNRWHHILAYRIIADAEVMRGKTASEQSGCYISEILPENNIISDWLF